ncbi:MAG: DNA methylase, partial [Chloroflexaceae bacterium]|nr:DNA methylase [Chloroflexaceae bacterium]
TADDLAREARTAALLHERFATWQAAGYIPSREITPGDKTDELIRTRGWTYWHHLFTPRQLLLLGLFVEAINTSDYPIAIKTASLLGLGRGLNYTSRLSTWHPASANENVERVFTNQALNTLFNYASRGMLTLSTAWYLPFEPITTPERNAVQTCDVRDVTETCDIWITDPPYADAINYHELTEYFLAWYAGTLPRLFPQWYTDSKRVLAIQGVEHTFRRSMVAAYRTLATHMPTNGYQIVMFTHQDARVWADLTLILWAAGLRVIAAWSIATETESALKAGNYVQGTVLLVLQKQTSVATAFLDEIYPQVEDEVQTQLKAMLALDDNDDPNFGDADYQLAAYAAALRVLTSYRGIEELDVARELERQRRKGEESPLIKVITNAVRIASDYLVPRGLEQPTWKRLHASERFYLKGLDLSSQGERRAGAYQELARGFGVKEYTHLLASTRANEVRLKTATELANRYLDDDGFGRSTLRCALFAVYAVAQSGGVPAGLQWLRTELPTYWEQRKLLIELLRFLGSLRDTQASEWGADAEAAWVLAGALENDHV